MKQNKLELISVRQGEFEVVITERLYKTIKKILSTKINKNMN